MCPDTESCRRTCVNRSFWMVEAKVSEQPQAFPATALSCQLHTWSRGNHLQDRESHCTSTHSVLTLFPSLCLRRQTDPCRKPRDQQLSTGILLFLQGVSQASQKPPAYPRWSRTTWAPMGGPLQRRQVQEEQPWEQRKQSAILLTQDSAWLWGTAQPLCSPTQQLAEASHSAVQRKGASGCLPVAHWHS